MFKKNTSFKGFTFFELLVVTSILAFCIGILSLNISTTKRNLENEALKLTILLELLVNESTLRNKPMSIKFDNFGYSFFIKDPEWIQFSDEILKTTRYELNLDSIEVEPDFFFIDNTCINISYLICCENFYSF